jgi:hypothetical protein
MLSENKVKPPFAGEDTFERRRKLNDKMSKLQLEALESSGAVISLHESAWS